MGWFGPPGHRYKNAPEGANALNDGDEPSLARPTARFPLPNVE